jgi:hypothetical protein
VKEGTSRREEGTSKSMGMQNISVSEPIEDSMDVDLQPSSSGLETTDPFGEMDGTVQTDNIQEAVRQVEAEH